MGIVAHHHVVHHKHSFELCHNNVPLSNLNLQKIIPHIKKDVNKFAVIDTMIFTLFLNFPFVLIL